MEDKEYSLRELMELVQVKHRETFMNNYLKPLLEKGIVERKYEIPNHPKQKYKLKRWHKVIFYYFLLLVNFNFNLWYFYFVNYILCNLSMKMMKKITRHL